MEPLLHGVFLAFGLILPLGVQNIFVFTQGATHKKFTNALPAIVTAAICDTFLISLAVTGISLIVFNFIWLKTIIFIIGFVFLIYMGWIMWRDSSQVIKQEDLNQFSPKKQITFATSVSLLNPHAIMDTIGVIGTSSLTYSGPDKWLFALACIAISWLWFLALAITGRKIGQLDTNGKYLRYINQFSAIIIWIMAIYIISQLF
ncbi:L-lysine exporter family protein LysE/ArgO [Metabacillus crassostreae]|uniref:LysE/ArgO family amino acid transporter n=1 Tax=Metabacillus crassostreae TaxID=929098 RepID=UPI001959C69D|nr:LysE/ArgO family amino acid transporter [Metabacillus crassostreae]MBM7603872.1 L-lysine exporter family protein LysE/ArgO [Metabacillus crassostreae]